MQTLLLQTLQWWIIIFILGSIALPFASKLFASFFDKGYTFSKTIGIVAVSYCALVLGTMHILPFTTLSLSGITFVLAGVSLLFFIRLKTFSVVKSHWKIFLFEEVLFFACLFFWAFIKSFQPDIHGLEKFMDYGFINSILRSTYFPPKDMWMTPLFINYYYFGHLMTAVLTKLSNLPSNITFNLMLSSLFAFTFLGSFSIGANLVHLVHAKIQDTRHKIQKVIVVGLLTAFLVTFAGNLHTLYTFFTPYQNDNPVPPTQLVFSPQTFPNQYWYPNATRFIYHTIHEFPMYSFVVSDLHGHVLDIPVVLLILAVLLVIFLKPIENWKLEIGNSLLLGALTGVAYMTNAWDGLIYCGVVIVLILIKTFSHTFLDTFFSRKFLLSLLVLLVSFVTISLPFSIFFKPFASQVGLICAPDFLIAIKNIGPLLFEKGYCEHSPLWQLGILYGFFFFWLVSFLAFFYTKSKKKDIVQPVDFFVLGLGTLGFVLILLPEFVYLKDIYTTYFRANTMFKLVYQSFILLSLVSSYTIYRIFSEIHVSKKSITKRIASFFFLLLSFTLTIIVLIYPFFAISSYFNNLKDFQGLDGTTYLKTINADDYKAVAWLNAHIQGQPVILEAQGDSYTDYERISSNTGLPTVFGWMVHEWLWRGTYDIVPGRVAEVKTLYESTSLQETKSILTKYHVHYVYIGAMERTKYPTLNEEKFKELGKIIYSSGGVQIYTIL
ncbi:MAG TPA: DUF2298 domain-containing protein [Candidatus Eisenbacteria bacterium]|nr:DUF2298 domain-containing protein [Candidatus Eisenbacteria bacterium]